jgi:hypothetical protein
VLFETDNSAVADVLTSGLPKDPHLAYLARRLAYRAVLGQFEYVVVHIAGVTNTRADLISRGKFTQFRLPQLSAESRPRQIPEGLVMELLQQVDFS